MFCISAPFLKDNVSKGQKPLPKRQVNDNIFLTSTTNSIPLSGKHVLQYLGLSCKIVTLNYI